MVDPTTSTPLAGSDPEKPAEDSTEPEPYVPNERELKLVGEIDHKFREWRQERAAHEPQWFINSAMFSGNHDVFWSAADNRLSAIPAHPNRVRRKINRIFAKVRARRAKFLKNRPTWIIIPATSDIHDKLDARATGKVLDFIWRKSRLEIKYRDALAWTDTTGRGYWWFYWNPDVMGRVQSVDPATGEKKIEEAMLGDVCIEVDSPFSLVVGDPSLPSLQYQEEIIRAKERTLEYVRGRYTDRGQYVAAENDGETFAYENRIASLSPSNGLNISASSTRNRDSSGGSQQKVTVKEYFRRPTAGLPKGKYCVIANGVLLKEQDFLPYEFHDMENPFPCVEFIDVLTAGRYWSTTVLEQMIDLQKEYNAIRSMVSTQIKLMGYPKLLVAKQHQIPEAAWTPDAGEVIEYNARPGISDPKPWFPPNIAADAWRCIDLIKNEFDDISQIFPASEGSNNGAQSGFQTNLLQEAADQIHTPDIRQQELAIEEAAFKIRRIIRQGYDIPRLITVASGSYEPEVFEFSKEDIDENADIIVQAGSSLPMLKGAKIQAALELYAKGIMGDPMDPAVRKRVLNLIDIGGMDDIYDYNRIDDDMINIENAEAEDGMPLAPPRFFENHNAHWKGHVDRLKSPAVLNWDPTHRIELLKHAILHAKYVNQAAAYQMSIEAGLEGLIEPPPPVALPGMPGMGGPQAGGPPQGGLPGPPTPGTPGGGAGGPQQQKATVTPQQPVKPASPGGAGTVGVAGPQASFNPSFGLGVKKSSN